MLLCSKLEINDVVLYCIVLYCIVLYCIVLYCIVLYCIVPRRTAPHRTAPHSTAPHRTAPHRTVVRCVALRCVALRCDALRCDALHYTALHCTARHCIALRCAALRCAALRCVALHCIALHCIVLYCIVLYCKSFQFEMLPLDTSLDVFPLKPSYIEFDVVCIHSAIVVCIHSAILQLLLTRRDSYCLRGRLKRRYIEFKYYADAIHSGPVGLTKAEVSPSTCTRLSPSLFTPHQIIYSPLIAEWMASAPYFNCI